MCFFLEVCYAFMLYMQPKMYTINILIVKRFSFFSEGNWVMSPRVASDGLWTVVATEKTLLLKATTEALTHTKKRKVTSTMTLFLFLKFISLFTCGRRPTGLLVIPVVVVVVVGGGGEELLSPCMIPIKLWRDPCMVWKPMYGKERGGHTPFWNHSVRFGWLVQVV